MAKGNDMITEIIDLRKDQRETLERVEKKKCASGSVIRGKFIRPKNTRGKIHKKNKTGNDKGNE